MTAADRIGAAALRIATATSIIRTRTQDADAFVRHGGRNGDLERRHAEIAARLEAVAHKLEESLA